MSKLYQRKKITRAVGKVVTFVNVAVVFFPRVYAQDDPPRDIASLFETLYMILLPASIIIGLFLIVINGYGMLTSEGDPRKVQTSKENLTSAILGLVFVLLALVIYRVVVNSFFEGEPFPG